MSEKTSVDQYGRKQWNLEAYENEVSRKRPLDASDDVSGAKLVKNMSVVQQRQNLYEQSVLAVKAQTLVSAEIGSSLTTYGKNKRFGFFCPLCDLSFRDTLALVDHLNLLQHAKKAALIGDSQVGEGELLAEGVRRATVDQVAQTIEELVKQLLQQKIASGKAESLQNRVRKREEFEAERERIRKEKRSEALRKPHESSEMGSIMGIEGFGTTKK